MKIPPPSLWVTFIKIGWERGRGPRKGKQRVPTLSFPENTRLCRAGQEAAYLVAGLSLPDEDESIGGDDGQAEVDEDDGPL